MITYPSTSGGGSPGPPGPAGPGARLTFDPSQPTDAAKGRYQTFPALYACYLLNPYVDIFIQSGGTVPPKPGGGNYVFDKGTRFLGLAQAYPSIELLDGAVFESEIFYFSNFRLTNKSSTPCLVMVGNYPWLELGENAWLVRGYSDDMLLTVAAPCLVWDTVNAGSGYSLSLRMGKHAELHNDQHYPDPITGPVIVVNGTGAGDDVARLYCELGQASKLFLDTVGGNAFSDFSIYVTDGTAEIEAQPNYNGANSPIDPANYNVGFKLGLNVANNVTIASTPNPYGAPDWATQTKRIRTEGSVSEFSLLHQVIPPVISVLLKLVVEARNVADGTSCTWEHVFSIRSDGSNVRFGANGMGPPTIYDPDPGTTTWQLLVRLNDPDPYNVDIVFIGEAGKDIAVTATQNILSLVLAF